MSIASQVSTKIVPPPQSSLDFSNEQMYAYFVKDDSYLQFIFKTTLVAGILCLAVGDIWLINYLLLTGTGLVFLAVSLITFIIIKTGIVVPTDEEYDAWISAKARQYLLESLRKIDQDHLSEDKLDEIFSIQGFVLAGTKNAEKYREQDILKKLGKDGEWRYSINVYTYFHPLTYQLAVFVFDINAVNQRDMRVQVQEYFYADVVAVTTEDEQDPIITDGARHAYRTESFALRICDGNRISATIRSLPLDHGQNLPSYDLPTTDVEKTISQLRMLLRSKKQ